MPHSLDNSFCQRFPSKIWFLCFQAEEMFWSLQELPSLYSIWIGMYISWQMYNILKKNGNESTRLTKTSVWCCRSPSVKYSCKTKTWGLQRETMSGQGWWRHRAGSSSKPHRVIKGLHQSHRTRSSWAYWSNLPWPVQEIMTWQSINTHRGSSSATRVNRWSYWCHR